MSLRRWLAAPCTLLGLSVAILSRADGLTSMPFAASAVQEASADSAGVQKDDSQLTVVQAETDGYAPIVDTAAIKKKKSFWSNKMFHPTQWFSSSKKK